MQNLIKKCKSKVDDLIIQLTASGFILIILAVLIVWTDFVLRLIIGLLVIVLAYVFFYLAYKIWRLKSEVEKYFKL